MWCCSELSIPSPAEAGEGQGGVLFAGTSNPSPTLPCLRRGGS